MPGQSVKSNKPYQVIIVGDTGDGKYRIKFKTKQEQWSFIKEFLPDVADMILNMTKMIGKFEPPFLWVSKDLIHSIEGITLVRKGD